MNRQKIFPRHLFFSFLISIFLIAAISACCIFIWQKFSEDSKNQVREFFTVKEISGVAQFKSTLESNWHLIQDNENFKNDASDNDIIIKTDFNSTLLLKYKETELSLQENSKIHIFFKNEQIFVEYISGSIEMITDSSKSDFELLASEKKITSGSSSEILISQESDFITRTILTVNAGYAELQGYDFDNPAAQPVFLLPPERLVKGMSRIIKKSALK